MAAIARRTWASLRDEGMKRLGREGVTAFESRMEYFLDAAYRLLTQTFYHPELDTISSELTLSTSASTVALPSDLYLPVGVRLLDNSSNFLSWLQPRHARVLLGRDRSSSGRPAYYARFGTSLYTDKTADTTYKIVILYYKDPPDPDFASGSPATNRVFDEVMLRWAVGMAQGDLWRPELSSVGLETMQSFLARMAHPPLALGSTEDEREEPTSSRKLGGGPLG